MTMPALTLGWVAEATGGTLVRGDASREIGRVMTDSRSAGPGDFFVALHGPRFDGHAFVGDVAARGASGVLVERERVPSEALSGLDDAVGIIEVRDALRGLQDLGRAVRRAARTQVIAITGSAGKTTTKEACAALLATRFTVVRNHGNLNNHIGLPLSLVQLRTGPEIAVMELGMNHAGEIRELVAMAEPDVRVWINVGDAHLGFFDSSEAIADAKAEILEGAGPGTLLVCNADDPRIMARVAGFPGRVVTFGIAEGAVVRAADIEDRGLAGMRARVHTPAGARAIDVPLPGRGNLANVLAAVAVGLVCGLSLDVMPSAIAALQPAPRRGAVHRLRDGIMVVDDSYNSSPAALRVALDAIAGTVGRRVAVLGEMLELGAHAAVLHAEAGRAAAAAGVAELFVIGGDAARDLARGAIEGGLPRDAVHVFVSSEPAAGAVVEAVRPGDVVLVKGSRGIGVDAIVDRLMAERG